MNFILMKSDSYHVLCLPAYAGAKAEFRSLFDCIEGLAAPWTFVTRTGADRARLAVDHTAKVATLIHDEIVIDEGELAIPA